MAGHEGTIAKLQLLRAETVVITDEANRSVTATRVIRFRKTSRVLYADSLYHPGATFRRVPGGAEGTRPRQASHVE